MKLKKVLPVAAVLVGTTAGSIGGYFYRDIQVSPALQSLSTALELVTGREARAQAAYETSQGKLQALQAELLTQEEQHGQELVAARRVRKVAEVSLRAALVESKRTVAVAEAVPIPAPIVIPDDTDDLDAQADYVAELKTSVSSWEFLAVARQDALEGLQVTQVKLIGVNQALKVEVQQEQVLRFTVERDRDLWKATVYRGRQAC